MRLQADRPFGLLDCCRQHWLHRHRHRHRYRVYATHRGAGWPVTHALHGGAWSVKLGRGPVQVRLSSDVGPRFSPPPTPHPPPFCLRHRHLPSFLSHVHYSGDMSGSHVDIRVSGLALHRACVCLLPSSCMRPRCAVGRLAAWLLIHEVLTAYARATTEHRKSTQSDTHKKRARNIKKVFWLARG